MKNYKKNLLLPFVCLFGVCAVLFLLPGTIANWNLIVNEFKTYFRPEITLQYEPAYDDIKEIQIGGAITMSSYDVKEHGCYIYTKIEHMNQITEYLNKLNLVEADRSELPNMSADAAVQYYNDNGLVRNYLIYGQVFIEDVMDNHLYRLKSSKQGIIKGLECMEFD